MRGLAAALAAAAGLALPGCVAQTGVLPLGKGELTPGIGIGGPVVEAFDTHVPVPYLAASVEYGLDDHVNAGAVVHVLPLAYHIVGLDAGVTWFPVAQSGLRPTLGVGPRAYLFASTKADVDRRFLAFPVTTATAAWTTRRGVFYVGANLAVPLEDPEYDEEAQAVIFSPFVGHRWSIGRRYALSTELKWHGANVVTGQAATGYTTLSGRGAVTPLIAFQWSY